MSSTNSRARILYCESNADGTIGGSHTCLLNLIERLDANRFEPITVFYDDHALVPRFRKSGDTIVEPKHDPWRIGTELGSAWSHRLLAPAVTLARRGVNFGKYASTIRRRMRFLRERGIDLVHLNNSITRHHDWMLACMLSGVPCVTHERGLNERYTWSDRYFARKLRLVISMSEWIRDHMAARGVDPRNIRVMYDGLDSSRLVVGTDPADLRRAWDVGPEQPVIGIVGNVRPWKGQEVVVRALVEIVRQRPDTVCFIVGSAAEGDREYAEGLRRIVADAGIERNIRFTGYQSNVPDFVNMMSVVIHASIEPEPFGMVVLEGMALGKPVIGSAAGGVVEMVVEGVTGYTFPPGDHMVLAARVLDVLADPARTRSMGEAGRRRVMDEFPLDGYVRDVEHVYDQILGRTIPESASAPAA